MANIIQLFKVTTLQLKKQQSELSLAMWATFLSKINWGFGKRFFTNIIISPIVDRYFHFLVYTL